MKEKYKQVVELASKLTIEEASCFGTQISRLACHTILNGVI